MSKEKTNAWWADEWLRIGWQKATHCVRCGKEEPDKWLCSYHWCRNCNKTMTEFAHKNA